MKPITVKTSGPAYRIEFGSSFDVLARRVGSLFPRPSRYLIVTSRSVARLRYAADLSGALRKTGVRCDVAAIPDGESAKNVGTLQDLFRRALALGLDRRSVVVAFGGGVVTDLAGFFAATFMRGVSYVSIPTTLLGMVDAAIGGKTAVDLPSGKNLMGAFWHPRLVWIDVAVLKSLPEREWKTGLAEVIKYGVIREKRLFVSLEKGIRKRADIRRWPTADLMSVIWTCARSKASVVSADERESPLKGGREILNFGHTAGHALEAATGYRRFTHGEAVAIGMAVAGRIALGRGLWSESEQLRLLTLLEAAGLPIRIPRLNKAERTHFWRAIKSDKKNVGGRLRFVLPVRLGSVHVLSGIPRREVDAALRSVGFYPN